MQAWPLAGGSMAPGVAITELDASQNPIGQQGATYLARLLNIKRIKTQFLCKVTLDHCHITDAGGNSLVC
jgi:endonuclease IV